MNEKSVIELVRTYALTVCKIYNVENLAVMTCNHDYLKCDKINDTVWAISFQMFSAKKEMNPAKTRNVRNFRNPRCKRLDAGMDSFIYPLYSSIRMREGLWMRNEIVN